MIEDMTVQDTEQPAVDPQPVSPPEYIDVMVSIPAPTAVALKHAVNGRLDIAGAASLVLQLYATAPLDLSAKTLTSQQYATICETLGFSPQTVDELVSAIQELTRISVGGIRVQFTAEDVAIMNARNATGMPPKEFARYVLKDVCFEAWKNGVIG